MNSNVPSFLLLLYTLLGECIPPVAVINFFFPFTHAQWKVIPPWLHPNCTCRLWQISLSGLRPSSCGPVPQLIHEKAQQYICIHIYKLQVGMVVQCVFIPSRFWLWTFSSAWAFLCGVCKLYVCTGFLSMNGLFNDGPACHDAQNLPLQSSQLSLHLSQMSFPAGGLQEGTPVSLFMKQHWSLYTSSSSGLFPPCFGFLIRF